MTPSSCRARRARLRQRVECLRRLSLSLWRAWRALHCRAALPLAALLLAGQSTANAEDSDATYRLGRGYPVGASGLRLGGYSSIQLEDPREAPWSFNVNDVALFVSWDNGSRLRFFSELEIGDALNASEQRGLTTQDAHFDLERLYIDALVNDNLTVRLGKFLTPIGQWNLIHADPLVWTTNRPLATFDLFSQHATGIMLHGSVPIAERLLDYAVYADASETLDPYVSKDSSFDNAVGAHVRYALSDTLQIGASYANFAFSDARHIRYHLAGIEAGWSYRRFEVSGEAVYRGSAEAASQSAWQGFTQGVAPLAEHWYAVGRYEFFEQPQSDIGQVGVLGLAFRPQPPLVWKLEYRLGTHNETLAPDGFSASFAVLF